MVGHLFVDGIAGIALIAVALLIRRFLSQTNERMATAAFIAGLAAAAVSLAVRRGSILPAWCARYGLVAAPLLAISGFAFPFNNGALLALLELTLLLLLVWVGVFGGLVARRSPTESAPEARVATT